MWRLLLLPHPPICLFLTVVLSAGLVAAILLVLSWFCAQGLLSPPELLVAMKESLLMSERKTSLL